MNDSKVTITLKCLFCDSPLKSTNEENPESGEMVRCFECGEMNDYDSVVEAAIEEGKKEVLEIAKNEIEQRLKKLFK